MRAFLQRNWVWIAVGVVIFGWAASSQGLWDYIVRRREHRELSVKAEEVRERVKDKQTRLERAMKDETYQELEARRQLGVVKPDEVEFRFRPQAGGDESLETRPGEPSKKRDP